MLTLTLLFAASPAFAIDVVVSDQKLVLDQEPVIEDGRTLVPMRAIFEALESTVDWDQENQMIHARNTSTNIALQIGSTSALVNNNPVTLDVPAKIVNGRTLVPVRFVAESLGANVVWDPATQGVYVNSTVPVPTNTFKAATVTSVTDGDTIKVGIDGTNYTVRLIGVDTPEVYGTAEYFGQEASNFTKNSLAIGSTVYLQRDVSEFDKYGRLLRYVWTQRPATDDPTYDEVASMMFNAQLVSNGYAAPSTYPPDVKYAAYFQQLSRQAFEGNWGLWGKQENKDAGKPVAPVYVAPAPSPSPSAPITSSYIGNSNSGKFHLASCRYAAKTSPSNRVAFSTRLEAINNGYVPCQVCKP